MTGLDELQKALDNRPIRCPPEKTQEEYIEEWEEWFEDFTRKFATYRADLEKKLTHIEVRNNTPQSIKVGICRSKLSGLLYIEVGEACHAFKVEPMYYEMVEINEVEF